MRGYESEKVVFAMDGRSWWSWRIVTVGVLEGVNWEDKKLYQGMEYMKMKLGIEYI